MFAQTKCTNNSQLIPTILVIDPLSARPFGPFPLTSKIVRVFFKGHKKLHPKLNLQLSFEIRFCHQNVQKFVILPLET